MSILAHPTSHLHFSTPHPPGGKTSATGTYVQDQIRVNPSRDPQALSGQSLSHDLQEGITWTDKMSQENRRLKQRCFHHAFPNSAPRSPAVRRVLKESRDSPKGFWEESTRWTHNNKQHFACVPRMHCGMNRRNRLRAKSEPLHGQGPRPAGWGGAAARVKGAATGSMEANVREGQLSVGLLLCWVSETTVPYSLLCLRAGEQKRKCDLNNSSEGSSPGWCQANHFTPDTVPSTPV